MPFNFIKTEIPDVIIIESKTFYDERGFLLEFYKKSDFEKIGLDLNFVQDNHSKSKKGVLRGLHFQKRPFEQGKLVRCIKGSIFDVVVDIRKGSKTFGKWVSVILSEENKKILWIPPGFAHGFLALEEDTEIIYKITDNEYNKDYDSGIIWNDKDINIIWPLEEYGITSPILSEKDIKLQTLNDYLESILNIDKFIDNMECKLNNDKQ